MTNRETMASVQFAHDTILTENPDDALIQQ